MIRAFNQLDLERALDNVRKHYSFPPVASEELHCERDQCCTYKRCLSSLSKKDLVFQVENELLYRETLARIQALHPRLQYHVRVVYVPRHVSWDFETSRYMNSWCGKGCLVCQNECVTEISVSKTLRKLPSV